jgi:hypothetical protein
MSMPVDAFFYRTLIACPAVTVRLRYDMGLSPIAKCGRALLGVKAPSLRRQRKASFRTGHGSETSRALRTAEAITDICRLTALLL